MSNIWWEWTEIQFQCVRVCKECCVVLGFVSCVLRMISTVEKNMWGPLEDTVCKVTERLIDSEQRVSDEEGNVWIKALP